MFKSQGLAYSAHRNQHWVIHRGQTSPVYHSNSHPVLSLRVPVAEREVVQAGRVGLRLPGLDQTADVAVDPCPRAALGHVSRSGGAVPELLRRRAHHPPLPITDTITWPHDEAVRGTAWAEQQILANTGKPLWIHSALCTGNKYAVTFTLKTSSCGCQIFTVKNTVATFRFYWFNINSHLNTIISIKQLIQC